MTTSPLGHPVYDGLALVESQTIQPDNTMFWYVLMFCHVLSICPAWLGLGLTFFYSITQGELHKACGKVGRRVSSIDHKILADSTSVGKPEGTSFILLVKRTLVHSNRTLQPETGLSENSVTTPHFMVDPSFAPFEWFRIAIWGYTPFSDSPKFCHVLSICPAWLGLGLTFFYSITQGELHKACGKVARRVSSIDHKILADSTSVGKPEGTSFILLVKRTLVHSNRTLQPETGLSENSVTTPHFMVDPSFAPLEWFRIAIWGYTPFSDSPKIILLATKMTIYLYISKSPSIPC